MATTPSSTTSMKGFYRQKKPSKSAISKKPSPSSKKKFLDHAAAIGSGIAQPPALTSHGSPDLQDDFDKKEDILRQFDMNMAYGPCLGMTRLARFERAQRLGLNPPKEIQLLLKDGKVRNDCLWDGRV